MDVFTHGNHDHRIIEYDQSKITNSVTLVNVKIASYLDYFER